MSFWSNLNLKEIAQNQLNNVEYWFRKKYNLSPKDPRYLNCELWEMALDLELDKQAEELYRTKELSRQNLNLCPTCKTPMLDNVCPKCGETVEVVRETYFDPDFEEYEKMVEAENAEPIKWEPVPEEAKI